MMVHSRWRSLLKELRLAEESLRECNELIVKHVCKSMKDLIADDEDFPFSKESQDLIKCCDLFSPCYK